MKRLIVVFIFFLFLSVVSFYILSRPVPIGITTPSDLRTYINNLEITSYNYNGTTFIPCRTLKNYGFDIETDSFKKEMTISPNHTLPLTAVRVSNTADRSFPVYSATWTILLNGESVTPYQIRHDLCIPLTALQPFGKIQFISAEQKVTFRTSDTATDESIVGDAQIDVTTAKAWAKSKNAAQLFIDAADIYWKYGQKSGLRPEVLYAQAAKETAYGKYTGNVVPEQHNFAGIKTAAASGDTTADHESFPTVEDGVRAHFNHMAAYVGVKPIGEVHARYHTVLSTAWAGTIRTVSQLGGRWAPDPTYGDSILRDYLYPMLQTNQS